MSGDFERRTRTRVENGRLITETTYGVAPGCLLWLVAPYALIALGMLAAIVLQKVIYG